jgi:membrane-associated phospholipid phosphatase
VPERYAGEEGEAERRRAEQWGPPRPDLSVSHLALTVAALAAALAGVIALTGLSITPDRYLLVLLVPALVLGRGRRYLLDFVPFMALIVIYAQFRGIAHLLRPHPFYLPQLQLERFFFGNEIPTAQLQWWLWKGSPSWYDTASYKILQVHFIVPPLLAFALWMRRRALFYRFGATMIVLSFAGALTFFLFPTAPPWAAANKGLLPMITKLPVPQPDMPHHHGLNSYTLSRLVHPNPYAAIPSLHAGYAFLAFLFVAVICWRTRWRWWAIVIGAIYPLVESFAVVYTANHYVVDLAIGFVYAAAALWGVERFWRWRGWPD